MAFMTNEQIIRDKLKNVHKFENLSHCDLVISVCLALVSIHIHIRYRSVINHIARTGIPSDWQPFKTYRSFWPNVHILGSTCAYMSHAARYPATWSLKFKICKCLGPRLLLFTSVPCFPPYVSHARSQWWRVPFNDATLASSVHIIPNFACTIKVRVTIICSDLVFGIWTWI